MLVRQLIITRSYSISCACGFTGDQASVKAEEKAAITEKAAIAEKATVTAEKSQKQTELCEKKED